MRVLVTDGDSRAALAVTRSLGRLGHEVIVAERRRPSLAESSRYCASAMVYQDPTLCPEGFLEDVRRAVRDLRIDALIPAAEVSTILLTRHRHDFEPLCKLPFAAAEDIERAADKVAVIRAAQRLNIPVPHTVVLDSRERLEAELPRLSYPIVIKPHRSRLRAEGRWLSASVSYARDRQELIDDLKRRHDAEFPMMLQERIVGPGIGVFACYDRGSLVAVFGHQRLREKPPSGGVGVLCESIPLDARAQAWAEELLRSLNWHGVAMVEFKIDERTQTPVLMEINGRFWGSLQLAIDAGIDFPAILIETLNGQPVKPRLSYRIGVRSRWFWGDVDALFIRLRKSDGNSDRWLKKMRAVLDFLMLWQPAQYYDNPKMSDWKPWLHETRQWLRVMTDRQRK